MPGNTLPGTSFSTITEALNNYVDKWETDNRKIRLPKRK
jgi:hypothetical protein